jgi:predicted Fe-S protein YdhL (DUF1289 family)
MIFSRTPTPCVGICSTTFGDLVCRGCRRYLHEIIDWNRYSEQEKRLILQRLDFLHEQILSQYFVIDNSAQLEPYLLSLKTNYRSDSSSWTKLYILLRSKAILPPWNELGVRQISSLTLETNELREKINQSLYTLALAYYEKDHLRNRR